MFKGLTTLLEKLVDEVQYGNKLMELLIDEVQIGRARGQKRHGSMDGIITVMMDMIKDGKGFTPEKIGELAEVLTDHTNPCGADKEDIEQFVVDSIEHGEQLKHEREPMGPAADLKKRLAQAEVMLQKFGGQVGFEELPKAIGMLRLQIKATEEKLK
jgi:hypothetical protein